MFSFNLELSHMSEMFYTCTTCSVSDKYQECWPRIPEIPPRYVGHHGYYFHFLEKGLGTCLSKHIAPNLTHYAQCALHITVYVLQEQTCFSMFNHQGRHKKSFFSGIGRRRGLTHAQKRTNLLGGLGDMSNAQIFFLCLPFSPLPFFLNSSILAVPFVPLQI